MKLKILAVLAACVMALGPAVMVLATSQPDDTPTMTNIHVNRNLLVTGDTLIYADYNLPYASLPTESAGDTYVFRILAANGTEVGAVTPYAGSTFNRGYNEGVFGIYFESGITWGAAYTIRLSESPAYFASPTYWNIEVPAESWTALTDQDDNQSELTDNIISAAERLEGNYENTTLVEAGPDGPVLSSPTGENYFRGAISGIQYMAPGAFWMSAVSDADLTPHVWTTTQFDTYAQRFNGTWVGNDTARTAEQTGLTDQSVMALFFACPVCVGSVILSSVKYKKTEPGFLVACLVIIATTLMGWFPTAITASLLQLCSIYISYVIFFSRG